MYLADKALGFNTDLNSSAFLQKTFGELKDLVERYEPSLFWSDGDWEAPDSYWNAPANFLAWLVNESPVKDTVVFNDRWGQGDTCTHGSYWTCDDRYLPSKTQGRKWENAFTLDLDSWGYRRNGKYDAYMTTAAVVTTVVETVALGGNALINVGPSHDGTIDPIFADRLLGLGKWLQVNGPAIYSTTPWRVQNETAASVWYTTTSGGGGGASLVNAIFTSWPPSGVLSLAIPVSSAATTATLLGYGTVMWAPLNGVGAPGIKVTLPTFSPGNAPCLDAWTIALSNIA